MERHPVVLLDTHAWIWWVVEPARLSVRARHAIDHADELRVSAISCWEIAKLVEKGRIELEGTAREWIRGALSFRRFREEPVTSDVAVASVELAMHNDPADRIIVATALSLGVPVVTRDRLIRRCGHVSAIW